MSADQFRNKTEDRRQNEAKLASLYEEYYNKIARYIFVRIGDRGEAEDLAGEVFLRALKSLDSYEERGIAMQAWLFKIAHNLVVDYFRKVSKRKTVSIDTEMIGNESDLQSIAEDRMELVRVTKALNNLTPAQRQIIELRFFVGLTSEDVGKILKKRDGAVRQMQSVAIKRLRQLLLIEESQSERELCLIS